MCVACRDAWAVTPSRSAWLMHHVSFFPCPRLVTDGPGAGHGDRRGGGAPVVLLAVPGAVPMLILPLRPQTRTPHSTGNGGQREAVPDATLHHSTSKGPPEASQNDCLGPARGLCVTWGSSLDKTGLTPCRVGRRLRAVDACTPVCLRVPVCLCVCSHHFQRWAIVQNRQSLVPAAIVQIRVVHYQLASPSMVACLTWCGGTHWHTDFGFALALG